MAGVVVWEWLSECSRWQAYEPRVSDHIEGYQSGLVHLNNVDASYGSTIVDLSAKIQLDRGSGGPARPVRRQIYPADSPAGQGITWQWSGDRHGEWHRYDYDVAVILESAFNKKQPCVDLSQQRCALPYVIDFTKLTQMRIETGFVRRVQRLTGKWRYTRTVPLQTVSSTSNLLPPPVHVNAPAAHSVKPLSALSVSSASTTRTFNGLPVPAISYYNGQTATTSFGLPSLAMPLSMQFPGMMAASNNLSASSVAVVQPHGHILPPSFVFGAANGHGQGPVGAPLHIVAVSQSTSLQSVQNSSSTMKKPGTRSRGTGASSKKTKTSDKQISSTVSNADLPTNPEDLLKPYFVRIDKPTDDEDCAICCEQLIDPSGYEHSAADPNVVQLVNCKHQFHKACLFAMYHSGTKDGSLQCPTCKTIYGTKFGNCPRGTMEHLVIPGSLSGYDGCNTIRIMYMVSCGVQGPEHPNPGRKFTARGFPRYGYLPDNSQGRKVLQLLVKAWERRLTFTIGSSVTTGETDTVVWNEIHHKTEVTNNSGHGYPDPNYLENVTAELLVHGITDNDHDN